MNDTDIQSSHTPSIGLKALVRGALLSAISVCVSMAALLITSKMFTNALDRETVGVFALLLVLSDFIIYASGMGLAASMPKLVAEADKGHRGRIIGSALAGQLIVLLALGAIILLLQMVVSNPQGISQAPAWLGVHAVLYLLPVLFIIGGLRDVILAMLAGLDRYGYRAAGIAAASIAQVILVYVVVWRLGGGLVALTLVMGLSYGIALVLLWIGLGSCGRPRCDWTSYKESVRFSAPLYLNQVMNFFNQRFDTVLVSALAGVANAAVYEMIKRLPVIVNRVMNALLVPYLPHISRLVSAGDLSGAARVLHHAVGISAFVGYGAALFLVVIQEWLIVLLFNENYLGGASVLGLLLVAASLALQSGLMAQMLIALGRNVAVPLVNMASMFITITVDLAAIPIFGMIGAAWTTVMASGISFLLLALYTHRAGVPVRAGQCMKPMLMLLLSALPLYYGYDVFWWRIVSPVMFAILCLAVGVVTPRQLMALAKAMVPSA